MEGPRKFVGIAACLVGVCIVFVSGDSSAHPRANFKGTRYETRNVEYQPISAESSPVSEVDYVDGPLAPLYGFLIQHRLQRFCKLIRDAGLEEVIKDLGGSWTLFAPTDASFIFLPGGTLEQLQKNPQLLRDFILYHFVVGDFPSSQIQNELLVDSVQGSPLRFNIYGQTLTVSGAEILEPDLVFEMGRVYIIDRPLYPTPSEDIVTYLQRNHREMYKLLVDTGLIDYVSSGTFTLLVPDDQSFDYLSVELKDALATNVSLAERILLNHILPGSVYVGGVTDGMQWETGGGNPVTFTIKRGLTFVNGIPIVLPDVPLTNGVIHVINRVLLPEDIEAECQCKPSSEANKTPGQISGSSRPSFGQPQRPPFDQGTTRRPGQQSSRPVGGQSHGSPGLPAAPGQRGSPIRPQSPSPTQTGGRPWSPSRTGQSPRPLPPSNQVTRSPPYQPDSPSDDDINSVIGTGVQPESDSRRPQQTRTTRYPPAPTPRTRVTTRPQQSVASHTTRRVGDGAHPGSENENYPDQEITPGVPQTTRQTDRWSNRQRPPVPSFPSPQRGPYNTPTTRRPQTTRTYDWNQPRFTQPSFEQPDQNVEVENSKINQEQPVQAQRPAVETTSWQQRRRTTQTTRQPIQRTTFQTPRQPVQQRTTTTRPPSRIPTDRQPFEPSRQQPNCRRQDERITNFNRNLPLCADSIPDGCQNPPYNPSDPRPLCPDPGTSTECRSPNEPYNPADNRPLCPTPVDSQDCRMFGQPTYTGDRRPLCSPSSSVPQSGCKNPSPSSNPSDRRPVCKTNDPVTVPPSAHESNLPQECRRPNDVANPQDRRPLCPEDKQEDCRPLLERPQPGDRRPVCKISQPNQNPKPTKDTDKIQKRPEKPQQQTTSPQRGRYPSQTTQRQSWQSTTRAPASWQSTSKAPASWQSTTRAPASWQSTTRAPASWQSTSRAPASWQSTSRAPASWQSTSRAPASWQSTTRAPVSWQTTRQPVGKQPQRGHSQTQPQTDNGPVQVDPQTNTRQSGSYPAIPQPETNPQSATYPTQPQSGSHPSQPHGGADIAPPNGIDPVPQTGVHPSRPQSGPHTSHPQTGRYPSQQQSGRYPSQQQSGRYPSQPQHGIRTTQPQSGSYPSQPQIGSHPTQPQTGSYPPQEQPSNPSLPGSPQLDSYPGQDPPSGPNSPSDSYPSQPQSGTHTQQPGSPQSGAHPSQPQSGSYPSQQQPGRPQTGSYPSQQQPGYPQTGLYPSQQQPGQPQTGSYPSHQQPGQPQTGSYPSQQQPGQPQTGSYPSPQQPGSPQSGSQEQPGTSSRPSWQPGNSYPSQPQRGSHPAQPQHGSSRPSQPTSRPGSSQPGRPVPGYPQRRPDSPQSQSRFTTPSPQTEGVSQPGSPGGRPSQPFAPQGRPATGQGHQPGPLAPAPVPGRRPTTTRVPISVTGTSTSPGEDSRRSLYEIVEDPALLIRGRPVQLTRIFELFHKAGIEDFLTGPGPTTVFLPSDDAFALLPKGVVDQLEENPELLRQILLYHVVQTEILPSSQPESYTVPSVEGNRLVITMLNGGRLIFISGAKAVAVTRANNGIFYVINQLLYPLPQHDIVGAIQTRPDLTTLAYLLPLSGLEDMLRGQTPYTLLAPTDNAFAQLPQTVYEELTRNTTALQEILLNHIIEGAHYGREFFTGGTFPSARGGKLKFQVVSYGYQVNEVNIKTPEIITGTGVIHLIDQVLLEDPDLEFITSIENSLGGDDGSRTNSQQPGSDIQPNIEAINPRRPTLGDRVTSQRPGVNQPHIGGLQPSVAQAPPVGPVPVPVQGIRNNQPAVPRQPSYGGQNQPTHDRQSPGQSAFGGRQPSTQGVRQPIQGQFQPARLPQTQPGQPASGQPTPTHGQRVPTGTFTNQRRPTAHTGSHAPSGGHQDQGAFQAGGQPNDVADLARSMGLNKFANWVTNTGLLEKIHDGGVYTVFAPTDDAVSSLPQDMVYSIESNPEQVKPILQYHIVPQRLNLNTVTNEETASTLLTGKTIRFNVYKNSQPDCKQLVTASGTPVGEALATMGSIQVIPVTQVLYQPSGNLQKIVEASPILQKLNDAVKSARLTWILSGTGPMTIFAPSDSAFDSLTEEERQTLLNDKQAFSDLLKRHIIRGTYFSSGIQDDLEKKSENNKPLKLSLQEGILTVNSVPVTYSDITATNGVLHVIDQFL